MSAVRTVGLVPRRQPHPLDAAWKDSLRLFFPAFLEQFVPDLAAQRDPSLPPRFLDTELRRIQRRARVGSRQVDVLVELPLREGGETWLLVHVEVQSRKDPDFEHRMWVYHYRAYDLYRRPVLSLAILADSSPNWRPSRWEASHFGCRVLFEFPVLKLLELRPSLEQLEGSCNPFALVVASHLRSQEAGPGSERRLREKLRLCRSLLGIGLSRDELDGLFLVLDAILALEPELEERFEQQVRELENEMELTVPNRWLEKGLQRGREEGREELMGHFRCYLRSVLESRFGSLSPEVHQKIEELHDPEQLPSLTVRAATVDCLEDFLQALR